MRVWGLFRTVGFMGERLLSEHVVRARWASRR